MTIEEYIDNHIDRQPEYLAGLYRQTHIRRLYPRMCCEPSQGRLLKMLTRMIRPMRILEIGAFSGYATLCFAEGMPEGAEIHSIEIDDEAEEGIRRAYDASPWAKQIHLHIGDALEIVPEISAEPWDLVFIDANKRLYCDYYRLLKPLVRPGGYILADNTLWSGKVTDTAANHDPQTRGVDEFNTLVAQDEDVEKVILPLRDGISIIRINDSTK